MDKSHLVNKNFCSKPIYPTEIEFLGFSFTLNPPLIKLNFTVIPSLGVEDKIYLKSESQRNSRILIKQRRINLTCVQESLLLTNIKKKSKAQLKATGSTRKITWLVKNPQFILLKFSVITIWLRALNTFFFFFFGRLTNVIKIRWCDWLLNKIFIL